MATELTAEELVELASAPASISVDGQSVSERPIGELLALQRALAAQQSLSGANPNGGPRSAWGRVRMAKAVPPSGGPH